MNKKKRGKDEKTEKRKNKRQKEREKRKEKRQKEKWETNLLRECNNDAKVF